MLKKIFYKFILFLRGFKGFMNIWALFDSLISWNILKPLARTQKRYKWDTEKMICFSNFLREKNFSQSDLRFGKLTFWSFMGRQRKKNLEVVFSGSSFYKYTTSLILCIYKYILYIHRDGHVCRSGNRRCTSDYRLPPSSDFLAPIVANGGLLSRYRYSQIFRKSL
jgi:hypothetical protein